MSITNNFPCGSGAKFDVGDMILSTGTKEAPWLKMDGATYEKSDYPLGEHLWGSLSGSYTFKKVGDYFVILGSSSYTYYKTLTDAINKTNGTSVTIHSTSGVSANSMAYYNGIYFIAASGYGYIYTSSSIDGPYTVNHSNSADDDSECLMATNHGVYFVFYDDSASKEYVKFTTDGTTFTNLYSGDVGPTELLTTSDGEYLYFNLYHSSATRVYQGSTQVASLSISYSGTTVAVVYNEEEGIFYGAEYTGSSGAYIMNFFKSTYNILGETVDTVKLIGQVETLSSRNITDRIDFRGRVFFEINSTIYIIYKEKMMGTASGSLNSNKKYIADENTCYSSSKIDLTKFMVPEKTDSLGTYYILGGK